MAADTPSLSASLPQVPKDRTIAITVGRWGGFYKLGGAGCWRVCIGFVAITYLRAEFTQVMAAWLDHTRIYTGEFELSWLKDGEQVMSAGDGTGAAIIVAADGSERRVNIGDTVLL